MADQTTQPPAPAENNPNKVPGDLASRLISTDWWSAAMLADAGIAVVDVPFVTVGGGIGSFVTVDYLRIYGVPTSSIRVLTSQQTPWESYEYVTRVSQIPRGERIRPDSASLFRRRKGGDGWAYQRFNYPKSVWGRQLKAKMRTLG